MNMTKKRVAELEGAQLDWAVAKAAGYDCKINWYGTIDITQNSARSMGIPESLWCGAFGHGSVNFRPSSWWAHGGPIIERERIDLEWWDEENAIQWWAQISEPAERAVEINGQTPLIAAMRAFVASKLGDEVEVPE